MQIGDLGTEVPRLEPVLFDDTRQINDNIRLNQLGYLPGYDKIAYLGQYMGSAGPMTFDTESFELVDREGKTVFTGRVTQRGVGDDQVGQTVYDLNFSTFEKPGTYRIRVTGVGLSPSFEIGPQAMTPLYLNYMRGHYHQRCGMEIDAAYSRHHRPACHLDDAYLEERVESLKFVKPKQPPLHQTNYDGKRHQTTHGHQATHGHHDAGDYGKYTISGSHYVFSVLNAMDVFPKRFGEDNLGLPYSGNRVPDLLDEVKWELDWLENMQDPADGGVFGVIKPNTGGYAQHMPLAEARRLFYAKDTVFTAAYAAVMARAARSPMAWAFLEKNDRYVQYFHYGSNFGDKDELNWAAAELYAATGTSTYHEYLLKHFDPTEKRWCWWPLVEGVGNATMTYTFMQGRQRDEAMLERCRSAIRDACRMHVEDAAAYPYRLSMPRPSISHGAYGWYFPGDLAGYNLLMGYALDGDEKLLQVALSNLDYICGANPSGYFLQTGLGAKRNIEVVDQESVYDRIIEPVPGLPLGIGSTGFYWLNQYGRSVGEGTYPNNWPLMNRWYDGFNVQTEFTMGPMMRETLVAAIFAEVGPQPHARPKVAIKADALQGPAPHAVQFSLDAVAVDGEIRQVFWDFGDETFSPTSRRATFSPTWVGGMTWR
ncbi:MAG: glycoside hydrolase family 9 protein [Phycisphaeraceae bacterium]